MYKNILIPIDGSPVSDAALRHAIALALDQRAHLHIVHVVDLTSSPPLACGHRLRGKDGDSCGATHE